MLIGFRKTNGLEAIANLEEKLGENCQNFVDSKIKGYFRKKFSG